MRFYVICMHYFSMALPQIENDSRSAVIYNVFVRTKYETWPATRWSSKLLIHCCLPMLFTAFVRLVFFLLQFFSLKHFTCFSICSFLLCFAFIFTRYLKPISIERWDKQISFVPLSFPNHKHILIFWIFELSLVGQLFWMNFMQKKEEEKSQQKFEIRPITKNSCILINT